MIYIGIDNGVTGTICALDGDKREILHWSATPVKAYKSYTKNGRFMNRIDRVRLFEILKPYKSARIVLENPMFHPDPSKIHATISAAMSLEATWTVLENSGIPYSFVAAVTWQKVIMPGVAKGDTKRASVDITKQLFPKFKLPAGYDGDAVLIAEYARQKGL